MAQPKFQSPFPPVVLVYEDKKELCRIAKRAVNDVVESFERYLFRDQREVNPAHWSAVKARDDVRVYHERRSSNSNNNSSDGRNVEVLQTIGTVVGSLDDAIYGVVARTTDAMRLRAANIQDGTITNCAVLANVQSPKADKPFRSMAVKWMVKTVPLAMRALMKPRDMVYLEATGLQRLSTGERVGFHLMHSIGHLPQTRPIPTYVRASVSVCSIWRQQSSDKVEVYIKSFIDAPERLLAQVTVRSAADSLLSVWRHMHCAQMKKLAWLLSRQLPQYSDGKKSAPSQKTSGRCQVCTSKTKTKCLLCAKDVCFKCCVKRDLWSIDLGNDDLVEKSVTVCVPCLTIALRTSSADLAREDMASVHFDTSSSGSTTSDGYAKPWSRDKRTSSRQSMSSSTSSERTHDTFSHSSLRPTFNTSSSSM